MPLLRNGMGRAGDWPKSVTPPSAGGEQPESPPSARRNGTAPHNRCRQSPDQLFPVFPGICLCRVTIPSLAYATAAKKPGLYDGVGGRFRLWVSPAEEIPYENLSKMNYRQGRNLQKHLALHPEPLQTH